VLFGVAVGPLGAVSIGLVILQPALFDAFCTLCLASAAISVLMIGPALDEVLASLQYLRREAREGRSWWARRCSSTTGQWWFESVLAGLALAALALVPTGEGKRFGGGWRALVPDRAERSPYQR